MGSLIVIILVAAAIFIYLLPTYVAYRREHANFMPIMLANVIFGCTIIGWIICLIWAFSSNIRSMSRA